MISRNGVYYDLNLSSYRHTENNITFVFSSQKHLDKFISKIRENREIINRSLSNRFNFDIDVSVISDIVLYRKIETRGFLLLNEDGVKLCQENLKYVGEKKIIRK